MSDFADSKASHIPREACHIRVAEESGFSRTKMRANVLSLPLCYAISRHTYHSVTRISDRNNSFRGRCAM
ncbi:hypothetical protein PSAB6_570050 [Paraburkholderia sabiae]|nr:hypothetical protein PSAB6_570050 [Paraburkholderia sabiae]